MRLFLENKFLKNLAYHSSEISKYPLIEDNQNPLIFGWPSFLAALDFEEIFNSIPEFDQTNKLFEASILTLSSKPGNEVLFYLYDRLFAECLTRIKELPQIEVDYLFHRIGEKRLQLSRLSTESLYIPLLNLYEKLLQMHPSQFIHDLILYLAWDRMCVWMAALFDCQSTNSDYILNLEILKDCLIESFQHLLARQSIPRILSLCGIPFFLSNERRKPSKAYEEEWAILSQSFHVLKAEEKL